ncbi:MAG: electron transfer flavoprotein subunit beta/FixA family protein [Lachnospiraceae bacterium]|nr:electron transfer flavoprotein subunit beta/FixA family protein [Lachnospiraceae bacterium]
MNILVCVKQVPDTTIIKIDPVTNTLIRKGVPSILNPFDGYALEAAARIKDDDPDTVITVVSMGPPQAKDMLKDCLAAAADKAYLVTAREFGGSDTLATSYIISEAIKKIEEKEGKFDAIFCGKQAIDGDTAQVGCEIAEHLGLPQVTYGLTAKPYEDGLKVEREEEDGTAIIGVPTPCLVTFTKPSWDLRYATIKRKMAARKIPINELTFEDFPDIDNSMIGLKGSPTRVKKTFVPEQKQGGVMIDGEDGTEKAKNLVKMLSEDHVL